MSHPDIPEKGSVMATYVGLSLSFCVREIAEGLVPLEDVSMIKAATAAPTPEHMDVVIGDYKKFYWSDNPEECERIARQLLAEGKVNQPRLRGIEVHNIADGHWQIVTSVTPTLKKRFIP